MMCGHCLRVPPFISGLPTVWHATVQVWHAAVHRPLISSTRSGERAPPSAAAFRPLCRQPQSTHSHPHHAMCFSHTRCIHIEFLPRIREPLRAAAKLDPHYRPAARSPQGLLYARVCRHAAAGVSATLARGAEAEVKCPDGRCSRGAARQHRLRAAAAVQKVFQGGAVSDLHAMLGITDAADVLYIGDHIYGDILKSKKAMGWRTMLIVPELQMELRESERCRATQRELQLLRQLRDAADERIHRLQWEIESPRCGVGACVCWGPGRCWGGAVLMPRAGRRCVLLLGALEHTCGRASVVACTLW